MKSGLWTATKTTGIQLNSFPCQKDNGYHSALIREQKKHRYEDLFCEA